MEQLPGFSTNFDAQKQSPRVVIISAFHDYRTPKRASIHQVASALAKAGYDVSFISSRFSRMSRRTGDSRLFLWDRSNQVETVEGVHCLLWRTELHPFHSSVGLIDRLNGALFPYFAKLPNEDFDRLVAAAHYVLVESSAAAIYLRRVRSLNPKAKIIYYAADLLATVGAHPFIQRRLMEDRGLIDHVILRSKAMAHDFAWAGDRLFKVGYGIDEEDFAAIPSSPYEAQSLTAVSVGSMLFDETFFQLAAPNFPDVAFHVIGCGMNFRAPENVHIHPEMPFDRTLPFVKHATIGVAAYRPAAASDYLAESSLKLAQFEYFGLPAVCPHFAVGTSASRIGYEPFVEASIVEALRAALECNGKVEPRPFPSWRDIALQVIEPKGHGAEPIDCAATYGAK